MILFFPTKVLICMIFIQILPRYDPFSPTKETMLLLLLIRSGVSDSATSRTVARQAPMSMGFWGKNTGVSCHTLLQRSFPTQGSNWSLLHCRQILKPWVTGKPTREQCAAFYPQPLMSLPSWAHFQYRQRAAAGKRKMSQTSSRNPTLRAAQGMSRFHCSLLAKTLLLPSVYSFPSEKIIIFEIMWSHILQSMDASHSLLLFMFIYLFLAASELKYTGFSLHVVQGPSSCGPRGLVCPEACTES